MTTKVEDNPLFKFGPPPIQTAEDAHEAFLRGLINEKELEEALARFGARPGQVNVAPRNPNLRIDDGFKKKIPDELLLEEEAPGVSTEEKIKAQDEKRKAAEKATKAATSGSNKVQRVETVPPGTSEAESAPKK